VKKLALGTYDLKWYYTGLATGASDNTASLGGTLSTSTITTGQDENVFDDVTGAESEAGESHYRAIGLCNTNTTYDYLNYIAWIEGYTRSGETADTIAFALERGTINDNSIQVIVDELTAPDTTNFQYGAWNNFHQWVLEGAPSNTIGAFAGNTLVGGAANENWIGIWLWRTIPAGASAFSNRDCTIKFRGETTGSPRMIIERTWKVSFKSDGQISVFEL